MSVYTYRYTWLIPSDDNKSAVCFQIVTDTVERLKLFEKNILSQFSNVPGFKFGREYLCEIDCSKICVFEPLPEKDEKENVLEVS